MAFIPMPDGATPQTDALRQQLMMRLMQQQGTPQTMGEGVGQAAQSLASAFLGRRLLDRSQGVEDAQNKAALDFLAGTPGSAQFGESLPGAGPDALQGLERGPGTPGALPGMDRQQIEGMLLMRGGREALMDAAMKRMLPEPMTEFQKSSLGLQERGLGLEEKGFGLQERRLGQDQSQFEASQGLAREKMAQDASIAAADRQARLDAAGLKNPLDVAKFKQDLRNEAGKRPEVAGYQQVAPAVSAANAAAKNDTKAADLNIVYAFATTMDPGSVVREGEQLMVQRAGSLSEQALGYINSLNGGGRLTTQQRGELLAELNQRAAIWQGNAVAAVEDVNLAGREAGVVGPEDQLIKLPGLGEKFEPGQQGTFGERLTEGVSKAKETAGGLLEGALGTAGRALGGGETPPAAPPTDKPPTKPGADASLDDLINFYSAGGRF